MANVFSRSRKLHELFKSERFLYPEFVPERLPHREQEIDALVFCFKPVLEGKRPQNVFLSGKTGTGKTATAKFVLNELESFTDRARGLYLNCFEYSSRHAVLSAITNFLGFVLPRRGIATDEAYEKMLEALKKADFVPIVVLDEFDQLVKSEESSKLLYDLLRVIEYQQSRIGLVLVSNDPALTSKLDPRVRSSLIEQQIEFSPYSPKQLKDILSERAKYAFNASALGEQVINLCAAYSAKLGGDARIALELLLRAGREAERGNEEKVLAAHVRKVISEIELSPARKALKALGAEEKALLEILLQRQSLDSGELYKLYSSKQKKPLGQRMVRAIVSGLVDKGILASNPASKGKGKTRSLSVKLSKELIRESLQTIK